MIKINKANDTHTLMFSRTLDVVLSSVVQMTNGFYDLEISEDGKAYYIDFIEKSNKKEK